MPNHRLPTSCLLALLSLAALTGCGGGAGRYQGMDADALFRLASAEFEEGKYGDAIETLDRLLLVAGDWPRVPEARLLLAHAHFEDEEYLTARSQYQRFLDRFAGHAASPDAALGICRSLAELMPVPERDQGYTVEAITACRNVVIDYAGLEQAREAAQIANDLRGTLAEKAYKDAQYYFRRRMYDSAIIYYEIVADQYPETDWAALALLGAYRANTEIGYDDLAEEARARLMERYPDSEAAAEIRAADGTGG